MCIRQNDGRKLNREAQAQIRITAVQRVLNGESPEAVVKSIGYQRVMIYRWLAAYRSGGMEALKVHKSSGRPPILSSKQMMICTESSLMKHLNNINFPLPVHKLNFLVSPKN